MKLVVVYELFFLCFFFVLELRAFYAFFLGNGDRKYYENEKGCQN